MTYNKRLAFIRKAISISNTTPCACLSYHDLHDKTRYLSNIEIVALIHKAKKIVINEHKTNPNKKWYCKNGSNGYCLNNEIFDKAIKNF